VFFRNITSCNLVAVLQTFDRYISTTLHKVVSRETALFISSIVIESNLSVIVPLSDAVQFRKYESDNQHS